MADDKLIFPIGFDLEAAVKNAGDDWDKKYADRLEKLIAKRPVNVKLNLDTSKLDSLDAVKKRLAELKVEPITPETKTAIKELARELQTLAKALEQVQKYSTGRATASPDAVRAARINEINTRSEAKAAVEREKARAAAARAEQAELRLAQARTRAATAATRSAEATRNANREYHNQDGYISRLIKRLAVYAGFSAIGTFLSRVREVTAEFELQRVSLGAIIQDQQRANQLFSEIKAFALTSPVSILDLTKYTKQLAAYKIGVDELFETTKKLTDVSVGLGVSMERIVLFYGQVRAKGWLTAQDLKQATEAGIPLTEELAKKLSAVNGELVTAGQVMDMISKRQISFEQVKEVFDDMTSAGGMFYNMQEKQGNTLYGMWAKLGDAASVMYEQIGNTESVNAGIKSAIETLTDLMRSWENVARLIKMAAYAFGGIKLGSIIIKAMMVDTVGAAAATRQYTRATITHKAAVEANNKVMVVHSNMLRRIALWNKQAALSTNLLTVAWNKLKVALVSWGPTVILAGLGLLINKLISAHENATRLTKALSDIKTTGMNDMSTSVNNFVSLANAAVNAADGTKKQRDALDELKRTYGNIIPEQNLTIKKLREMKGEYTSLTAAIKENIAQMTIQKSVDAIKEDYGPKLKKNRQALKNYLQNVVGAETNKKLFNDQQAERILQNYERYIDEGMKYSQAMRAALELEGEGFTQYAAGLVKNASGPARQFYAAQVGLKNAIKGVTDELSDSAGELGMYQKAWQDMQEFNANMAIKGEKGTFAYSQEQKNEQIKNLRNFLQTVLGDAWSDSYAGIYASVGKDADKMSELFWRRIEEAAESPAQQKAVEKAKVAYYQIIPQSETVRLWRDKAQEISKAQDFAMNNARKFLIGDTQSLKDYRKNLEDEMKNILDKLKEYAVNKRVLIAAGKDTTEQDNLEAKLEQERKYVEALLAELPTFEKPTGGAQSDPRLGILQEMVSTLKQVNKEYDELAKKEGATKALADTQRVYADTFKNMQQLATKYKFKLPDFGVPTDTASLTKYLEAVKKAMAKLPKSDKAVLALQVDIEKLNIDDMQKQIEAKLKTLSEKIARTKTAREFYDRILAQTGDVEMAGTLTMNVYGEGGEDLFNNTVKLLQEYFSGVEVELPINFATQQIDYKALRKIWEADKALPKEMRKIPEAYDSAIKQMLDSADSANQKMIEGWLKATEKAKTYSDKLTDVYRTTATEIERIKKAMEIGDIDAGIGADLIAGYERKQAESISQLEYEAFKNMPLYVQMFDDLNNASTSALSNMRTRLIALQGEWRNLDPTQLKEMQSRLNEIDAQLAQRNPFKTLSASIKEYKDLQRDHGSENKLNKEIEVATDAYLEAKAALKKQMEEDPNDKEAVENLQKRVNLSEEELKQLQKIADAYKGVKDSIKLSANELSQMLNWAGDVAKAVADISEVLGADEEDVQYWNTVADSLGQIAGGIQDIVSAAMSLNVVSLISSVLTAVPKMFVGFVNLFNAGKIRDANKEIKKQAELLERLEYTYSRLEKEAEKVFGTEYIANYNRQLKILNAQAEAYRKQAAAERDKGKKADKEKIKEYENAARDTMNNIADMQGQLMEKFTGTSRYDVAKQMAQSWFDARVSMSNTFAAIKSDYKDMIKNMIVEGAAARIIEQALAPMWENVDRMLQKNDIDGAINALIGGMDKALGDANRGMEVLWTALEARGYDMKQLIGDIDNDYTGIKRDIASASEEQITGLAATMNTWSYYVSFVPGISADVAAIRQAIERGLTSPIAASTTGEWTDWQQQAMNSYLAIQRNTADTVVECRRAAVAAENAVTQLKRVITNNPSNTSYGVKVFA